MFCVVFFLCFCSACFCFSLENDATHAKHAQACFFCSAFFVGFFEKKTETFLKSVNIRRLCTGKREVVCKKHYNLCFSGMLLSFSRKLHSARGANKKTRTSACLFFAPRALPAPSLTHSLACPWLLGGNSNLKQNLSFIKVFYRGEQKTRRTKKKNTRIKNKNTRSNLI